MDGLASGPPPAGAGSGRKPHSPLAETALNIQSNILEVAPLARDCRVTARQLTGGFDARRRRVRSGNRASPPNGAPPREAAPWGSGEQPALIVALRPLRLTRPFPRRRLRRLALRELTWQ